MKKRVRKKYKVNGRAKILGVPEYLGEVNIPTSVELIQYNEKEYSQKTLVSHAELEKHIDKNCVNWFKVTGISDSEYVTQICKSFGLHGFDIRELLADSKVVKFVLYEDVTFSLVSGFYFNEDEEIEDLQMAFILGDNFVISFKESPILVFKDAERAIVENNITIRQKGADFLLYILLNVVNSFNNDLIMKSEDNLLAIEDELILQQETVDILHILHSQRIAYMQLKRFMSSMREEFQNLLENSNEKVKAESMIYFENLDDKFRTTSYNLDSYQESIMSLLDLYYNNNNLKMNEVMKRLTLVATIFIPLTFLVGVWGMNFDNMPETEWKYGYFMAWGIFVLVVVVMTLLMKKKKWF